LLGTLADERFALLVNLGRKITDFQMGGASAVDAAADARQLKDADEIDDTYGVNVQFEDSEEEENDNELMDDAEGDGSADEDEGGVEAGFDATLKTQGMKEEDDDADKSGQLHARDVDAYWLQRSLNKFIDDPIQAQRKAKEIIDILQVGVFVR
jgi:pre-mRNA-splicing helicase BRR2